MDQSDQKPIEELYATVVGYVQGVGFRYFVVEKAQRLGLRGYVRNRTDGDVEVVAQGTRPALRKPPRIATARAISSRSLRGSYQLGTTDDTYQRLPHTLLADCLFATRHLRKGPC